MKHLLFLVCFYIIQINLYASGNTVPLKVVYKYLADKYSNKTDSEIKANINLLTADYLKSILKTKQITSVPFYNNDLDIINSIEIEKIFKIDTATLNKRAFLIGFKQFMDNVYYKSYIKDENGADIYITSKLTNSKYIDDFNRINYKKKYYVEDTILAVIYSNFKNEFSKIKNNDLKIISLLKLEIFASHSLKEEKYLLLIRLQELDNTINTKVGNIKLAELYYNFGNILKDAREEEIGYGYYYKSYQIGLKDYNLFSKQSHLELLKSINNDYYDLAKSKNTSYNHYSRVVSIYSNTTKLFENLLEEQKLTFLKALYFNKTPTTRFDIEYSLMLYNTIFNMDFRYPQHDAKSWTVLRERFIALNQYALAEIINLLRYAESHNIDLDHSIVANSLTNVASYYWDKEEPDLHVYSSYAAFKSFQLSNDNYNQYTNLYKMFCDVSGCYNPYYKGISMKFINDGLEVFKTCDDQSGYYKMLSSKMIVNLKRRKFDIAKAIIDTMNLLISPYGFIRDENDFLLKKLDYDYYNSYWGFNVSYVDTAFGIKDSILKSENKLPDQSFDYFQNESLSSMQYQHDFLESIQSASSEIEQLGMKKEIIKTKGELAELNKKLETAKRSLRDTSKALLEASNQLKNIQDEKVKLLAENKIIVAKNKKAEDDISTLWTRTYIILGILVIAILGLLYFIIRYLKATVFEAQFIQKRLLYHQFKSDIGTFSAQLTDAIDSVKDIIKDNKITNEELENDLTRLKNYSSALFDYFRSTIINSKTDIQSLSFEIENVSKYVTLHNSRSNMQVELKFGSKLQNNMNNCTFPTNLLQPIIENAIVHGFKNRPHDYNEIIIDLVGNGRFKMLSISDNGNGINKAQMKQKIETQNKKTSESENAQQDTDTSVSLKDIEKYLKNLRNRFKTRVIFSIKEIKNNPNTNGALVQFKNIKQW